MVARDVLHPLAGHADDGMELGLDLGIRTGFGDDWLRLGAMKIFSDGSLVGRTAAMHDDFADTPGEAGYLQADADELLARSSRRTDPAGRWRRTPSGTGPSTWRWTRTREAQAAVPGADTRHRIEHFAVSRPDQVERAASWA